MDKLFTLSAELTLEAADFLQGLRQAEQSARAASQTIQGAFSGMAASVCVSWNAIAASIQSAVQKSREFAALSSSGALSAASGSVPGHAAGLAYVPYDNYLARLHQGESVLSRAEASRWREGASAQGGPAIDYARLGQAVASALGGLTVQMDAQAVGLLVAPTISRELGRQVKSRQYTV